MLVVLADDRTWRRRAPAWCTCRTIQIVSDRAITRAVFASQNHARNWRSIPNSYIMQISALSRRAYEFASDSSINSFYFCASQHCLAGCHGVVFWHWYLAAPSSIRPQGDQPDMVVQALHGFGVGCPLWCLVFRSYPGRFGCSFECRRRDERLASLPVVPPQPDCGLSVAAPSIVLSCGFKSTIRLPAFTWSLIFSLALLRFARNVPLGAVRANNSADPDVIFYHRAYGSARAAICPPAYTLQCQRLHIFIEESPLQIDDVRIARAKAGFRRLHCSG